MWLKEYWPTVKKLLSYAWSAENPDKWDPDRSGILKGRQHHTLDTELFSPSAWLMGFYLAALKACAEMADDMEDKETAESCRKMFQNGAKMLETELFDGKQYLQKIDLHDKTLLDRFASADPEIDQSYWNEETGEIKYQYGEGSLVDQMVAQWHACQMGLGDVFDPEHRKIALKTMFDTNFMSMRNVANPCRLFAVNDESGALICAWREGAKKPAIPIPYAEECMTGFEYAAAELLMQNGFMKEGLQIVRAIRARYDGKKRNPFSEIECGASYARAMASFCLLPILAGFRYDMPRKQLGFAPQMGERPFRGFWSAGGAWGTVQLDETKITLNVLHGTLELRAYLTEQNTEVISVLVDDRPVRFTSDYQKISLENTVSIQNQLVIMQK